MQIGKNKKEKDGCMESGKRCEYKEREEVPWALEVQVEVEGMVKVFVLKTEKYKFMFF